MRLATLIVTRLAWAAILLILPGKVFMALGGGAPDRRWRMVARVLGVRHLAEALLERRGGTGRIRTAALVDTLHAASAVSFAALDSGYRRVGLTDACVAGSFAAYGWHLADGNRRMARQC